tara:strand:- start:964 stop:1149 length:186 start_codon:yes stop_codon:yes gene_type:complete
MGIVIKPLEHKTIEKMEFLLSKAARGLVPIEIDGIVYYIPKSVQELIDSLSEQFPLKYTKR